jgi:hypothetical protein
MMEHPAARMWSTWISQSYTRYDSLERARDKLKNGPVPALQLPKFWSTERVSGLGKATDALTWERHFLVCGEADSVRAVNESAFTATPPDRRFCRHDRAIEIGQTLDGSAHVRSEHLALLRFFFAFSVLTPGLASWIAELLDSGPLRAGSIEISRYRSGDFITKHNDAVGKRICNLVSYLGVTPSDRCGGFLVVTGSSGEHETFLPSYNSVVILPIAKENFHEVTPWERGLGRMTISISFFPEK